jgi:N-acyl-D-amino-acid deacylase
VASYDVVIRNGQVADGTGRTLFAADVALKGDRIASVDPPGTLRGDNEIDAAGKVVAPGFIDVHTHDDTALIDNPTMAMKASQGVTTVVCGNCGASAAPVTRPEIGNFLTLIVKKKENLSKTFAEFAAKVEAARPAINSAFLIGHSTLRMSAMGNDLARRATLSEIRVMREMLDQSLQQGAIGLSSGLFYPPAMAATTDEVAEVAKPLGKWRGLYTSHMRDEGDHILESMDETFEIGRRVGAEVVVSHHKCTGRANFGRMKETLPKFTAAMKRQQISFDVYPYVAGSTILRKEMLDRADKVLITWSDKVTDASGRDLSDIARDMGCSIDEAADRLQPAGAIYFMMDERDVQAALSHPGAMIGSDGIPFDTHPHPRLWGTFPRVLGHYARELKLFSLEDAVRRMTSYPAQRFHLAGRGEIRPGFYADICIFDPATVIDTATFEKPISAARGIDLVLCNGAIAWCGAQSGGGRSGRVLRRQQLHEEAERA